MRVAPATEGYTASVASQHLCTPDLFRRLNRTTGPTQHGPQHRDGRATGSLQRVDGIAQRGLPAWPMNHDRGSEQCYLMPQVHLRMESRPGDEAADSLFNAGQDTESVCPSRRYGGLVGEAAHSPHNEQHFSATVAALQKALAIDSGRAIWKISSPGLSLATLSGNRQDADLHVPAAAALG